MSEFYRIHIGNCNGIKEPTPPDPGGGKAVTWDRTDITWDSKIVTFDEF